MFQTHRSGDSPFNYTIPGFEECPEAEVTLGFAENWKPGCRVARRIMDINVNGEVFARNLDVFAFAGCEQALVITKTYAPNEDGAFVIEFTTQIQNPMVSLIAVDCVDTALDVPPSPPPLEDAITALILVAANGRDSIVELEQGSVIDLAVVGYGLSIVANTTDAVDWTRFRYDGLTQVEGAEPYAMDGKQGACCFNAVPYLETVEDDPKTLVVEAFDVNSNLIGHRTISFTVVDTAGLDGDVFPEEVDEERGSLFPVFDVLIDVFSDENTDVVSLTGENFRSYYVNESIAEGNTQKCSLWWVFIVSLSLLQITHSPFHFFTTTVPAIFEEVNFQSHLAADSESPFIINVTSFEQGQWAEVTLGFAENYFPNCREGKRVIDITVNGESFARNLDVFAFAGCYTAFVKTEIQQADATGSFVIELSASVQNPFVSLIAIDSIVYEPPTSAPTATPSSVPSDAPSIVPTNAPTASPSSVPSDAPSVVPSDLPSIVPAPTFAPSAAPSNLPSDLPSLAPSDAPSVVPSDLPSLAPSDGPTLSPTSPPTLSPSYSAGSIEQLVLVNATDRSEIEVLESGSVIDLSAVGGTMAELSIRADMSYPVNRVRFTWNDGEAMIIHNEGAAPYVMNGKDGATAFNPVPYLTKEGSDKSVVVTAYANETNDSVLGYYNLTFSVIS